MSLKIGSINKVKVVKETDIAYLLTDGIQEIFLHKRQVVGQIEADQEIEVFLYYDNQRRITATMNQPFISDQDPAFCEVVEVRSRLGVFLHIGIQKDLLLSRDDLPFEKAKWPQKGDYILAKIKVSKNQLVAKIVNRYDLHKHIKPDYDLELNQRVEAIILFFAEEGIVLSTKEGHLIFVYNKHIRKEYRLGQVVEVTIKNIKVNYEYNGMLIEQKEIMIDQDAQTILEYLKNNQSTMNITDKSSPDEIFDVFHMSKSAFKRALGNLYKQKLVTLEKDKVLLKEEE